MRSGTFHILVGIDFSDSSAGAMYAAAALAERLRGTLHLVHIAPSNITVPTAFGLADVEGFDEARRSREEMERLRAMLSTKVDVELHMYMGEPVAGILTLIKELKPDMVVVGSHGRGDLLRLLMGSVSTELVRKSPVPVLVVPAPGRLQASRPEPEPVVEPSLPAVGTGPNETLDLSQTNDANSGSVNLNPSGMGSYDVNPELRVRY